jgi:hypothetical protein
MEDQQKHARRCLHTEQARDSARQMKRVLGKAMKGSVSKVEVLPLAGQEGPSKLKSTRAEVEWAIMCNNEE